LNWRTTLDYTEVTSLLKDWAAGNQAALERLIPLVHGELHRLAHRRMRNERARNTLQTTALVNEAYLRLVDVSAANWNNRLHFFAVAAKVMRRILVDAARERASCKRGGHLKRAAHSIAINFDEIPDLRPEYAGELPALDDALTALAGFDTRKAKVVELRFFGGLSVGETAEVLQVSEQTVMRDWKLAKAWLMHELNR
jgi:RNA polymerase sigma factor (TIGR02999 family)